MKGCLESVDIIQPHFHQQSDNHVGILGLPSPYFLVQVKSVMPLQLHPVWIIQCHLASSTLAGLDPSDDLPAGSEFPSRTKHSMMPPASEWEASRLQSLQDLLLCMGQWVKPCPGVSLVSLPVSVHLQGIHLRSAYLGGVPMLTVGECCWSQGGRSLWQWNFIT